MLASPNHWPSAAAPHLPAPRTSPRNCPGMASAANTLASSERHTIERVAGLRATGPQRDSAATHSELSWFTKQLSLMLKAPASYTTRAGSRSARLRMSGASTFRLRSSPLQPVLVIPPATSTEPSTLSPSTCTPLDVCAWLPEAFSVCVANCRPATWIFCAAMPHLAEGSSGESTVAATCTLPILAAALRHRRAVANASDLPSAAPSMVNRGHSPRTRNRPVKLPCVSGTQSLSDAMARSTVALMACARRAVHRHPALARAHAQVPCSCEGAANSSCPRPRVGLPRSSPDSAAMCTLPRGPCPRVNLAC